MQRINQYNNQITLRRGDLIAFTVETNGTYYAEVGELAQFVIKNNYEDPDEEALYILNITIEEERKIKIYVPTSITETWEDGNYEWGVVHYKQLALDYVKVDIINNNAYYYPRFIVRDNIKKILDGGV